MRVLQRGRRLGLRLMVDRCEITIPKPGGAVWDPETGQYIEVSETIYSGKCRVLNPYSNPERVTGGATVWASDRHVLWLPVAGTRRVGKGATVTIVESRFDEPGLTLIVESEQGQTHGTTRRLSCRAVEHGV